MQSYKTSYVGFLETESIASEQRKTIFEKNVFINKCDFTYFQTSVVCKVFKCEAEVYIIMMKTRFAVI